MAPPTNVEIQAGGSADPYRTPRVTRETGQTPQQAAADARKQQAPQRGITLQELAAAVDEINERAQNQRRSLQFSIERELNLTVVKVVNPATDEVIRQIPSEEFVEKARSMEKTRSLLFNAEA